MLQFTGRKIVVVGAGVGGLVAAARLSQQGHRVTVFEPTSSPGGLAAGFDVQGTPVERYYHHLFRSDTTAARWIREVGMAGKLEFLAARNGIYTNGRLYSFGTAGSLLTFSALRLMDRLRLGMRIKKLSSIPSPEAFEDQYAMTWLRAHASRREMDVFWEPLLAAKFNEDRDKVSMAWLWARFRARVAGSTGGTERLGYIKGGFQAFNDALANYAQSAGVSIHYNARVTAIQSNAHGVTGVTAAGEQHAADVVLWTPALSILPRLVPDLPKSFVDAATSIRYHGAVVAVVELEASALPYYWVTCADASIPFTVAVEHTRLVGTSHYGGRTIVYLGRYASPDDPIWAQTDDETTATFLASAARAFSQEFARPLATSLFRAPTAQPVPPPGWEKDRPPLATGLPGLYAANIAQIYPWDRGVNFSLQLGEAVAAQMATDPRLAAAGSPTT